MKFNYQARTKSGEIQIGVVEASSKPAALNLLRTHGLYVTVLEKAAPPFYAKRIKLFERITQKDVVMFSRYLALMFGAGIPLTEALRTLSAQIENHPFREVVLKLAEEVEGGTSLSTALSNYPKVFSPFYVSVTKSGEVSGTLSESLSYLADHLEREYHLTARLKGAMIYPALVVVMSFFVIMLLSFFVIPHLLPALEETGAQLPTITKWMIGFSHFLKQWWLLISVLTVAFLAFVFQYRTTKSGKRFFDRLLLQIPGINSFLKTIYLTRFAENLSTLISVGLPITTALETSASIVGNVVYEEIILDTREKVKRGESISSVLEMYPEYFSPMFCQMVLVGERTGKLDKTLSNVVAFYQKEIDRNADTLLNLLEPLLVIFLGVVVATIVAGILLPIYQGLVF